MILDILQYAASAGVIVYMLLLSVGKKSGFIVGVIVNIAYMIYSILTGQWGLAALGVFLIGICINGIIKWKK